MRLTLRDQRDRASRYFLYGLLVLLPLTVVFGHKGVAPWLLLASLPAFARGDFWQSAFGEMFDKPDIKNPFFAGFLALVFFCFWIFISGFWSPKAQPSMFLYVMAPLLVGGSVVWFSLNLPHVWTYRLAAAFALSIAGGMAVLLFEGLTDGFLRSILPPEDPSPDGSRDIIALGRGVTALAPALFPAAIIVSVIWNRYAALGLLALGVAAAFTNDVNANAVAIAAGLSVGVLAFKISGRIIALTGWALIALLTLAPVMALLPVDLIFQSAGGAAPPSWLHRLAVWQSVGARIPDGLPFGFGADYARIWKETAAMIDVPGAAVPLSLMPTHPHNLFLQIWLELGLPGVMAMGVFFYCGMRVLQRAQLPAAVAAALAGAVAAIAVSIMVEGSLWQVWRLAAMALAGMGLALSYSLNQKRVG